jgi:predicted Zn-dependent protease
VRLILSLLLAVGSLGCPLHFRPESINPFAREVSVEQEIELGADLHRQIRAQADLITDPVLLDYVNETGQRIVRVTEPQPFAYRFNLIKDSQLNAFAVPGGYIYLHTGVLAQAGNLSELAGVLAHEVAHVRRRHIARAQEKQGVATLATLAAIALSRGDPAVITLAAGINVSLQLKHSREHEADADRQGIDYMVRAGFEPDGMIRFFQRILTVESIHAKGVPPYLFSHPALQDRVHAARVEIQRLDPGSGLVIEDARLASMQARLAALLSPVAGGTGLQARASFDRAKTDTVLEAARADLEAGRLAEAEERLAEAERLEPNDPRVALARGEVAEALDDLDAARRHLERAFALDPGVPLVQYRLGLIHKRLGDRTRAVFYLEQAATRFRPNSSGRRRAELEIERLAFPLLEASGVAPRFAEGSQERFRYGETVIWWGQLSRRFAGHDPRFEVRWIDPEGNAVQTETARIDTRGHVSSTLELRHQRQGRWSVEVEAEGSPVERPSFEIVIDGDASTR